MATPPFTRTEDDKVVTYTIPDERPEISPGVPAGAVDWLGQTNFGKLNQGKSDEKMAQVAAASAEKKAMLETYKANDQALGQLSVEEALSAFGTEGIPAWREARDAEQNRITRMNTQRNIVEEFRDAGLSIGRSATNLVGSAATMLASGEPMDPLGNPISDTAEAAGLLAGRDLDEVQDMLGEEREGRARIQEAARGGLSKADEFMSRMMSDSSQASEEQFEVEQSRSSLANSIEHADAPVRREYENFKDAVSNVFSNPEFLANQAIGETATLALGVPARGAAAASAARGIAMRIASEEGIGIAEAAAKYAANPANYAKVAEELTDKHARNWMAGMVGGTEAAGANQQAYQAVMETPLDELARQSKDYNQLLEDGHSTTEARRILAERAGQVAFAVAAPIAIAAGKVAAPFELAPFSSGARAGSGAAARLIGNVGNIMGETVEETVQGAGSEFASNVGQRLGGASDRNDLFAGTGASAGTGAAVAAGMSGALQAPSTAKNALIASVKAAVEPIVGKVKAEEQAQKARATVDRVVAPAPVREAVAAAQAAPEAAPVVAQGLEAMAQDDNEVAAVQGLAPEVQEKLTAVGEQMAATIGEQEMNQIEQLQARVEQVQSVLDTAQDMTPADKIVLQSMVAGDVMKLRGFANQLENDPGADPDLKSWINERAFGERANAAVSKFSKDLLESGEFDRLQKVFVDPNADESQKVAALQVIQQGMVHAAADLQPEVVEQLMQRTDLRPWVRSSLERIQQSQADEQTHREELTAIAQSTPAIKNSARTTEEVSAQIFEGGWGKNRKSLRQYQSDLENAAATGNQKVFEETLSKLKKFAENQVERVRLIDAAAVEARAKGLDTINVGTKTLSEDGRSTTDKPFVLRMNSPGSLANIPVWRADAMAMARLYNQYSSLSQDDSVKPIAVPKLKSKVDLSGVESSKNSSPAEQAPSAKAAPSLQESSSSVKSSSPPTVKKVEPVAQKSNPAPADTSESETNPPSAPAQVTLQPDVVAEREFAEIVDGLPEDKRKKLEDRRATFLPERDAVTGLHTRGVLRPALDRVHADSGNVPYVYAEADLRNLSGLNARLGSSGADPVLREAGQLIYNTLVEAFGAENVLTVRKGGDEFGVVVRDASQEEVDRVMQEASNRFDAYVTKAGLQDTPRKGGVGNPGTGIYFATAPIHPEISIQDTLSEADLAVEAQKQEINYGNGTREEAEAGRDEAGAEEEGDQAGTAPVAEEQEGAVVSEPEREESEVRAGSIGERFSTLQDAPGEYGQNQLLAAFDLSPNSTNFLARNGAGAVAQLQAAFAQGLDAVRALSGNPNVYFSDEELQRMAAVLDALPKAITQKLNDALHTAEGKGQSIAQRVEAWVSGKLGDKKPLGAFADKMGIWATNVGSDQELAYDPAVAEAMSMAAFQFILHNYLAPPPNGEAYVGGFLGKPAEAVTEQEKQVFSLGFQPKAMIDSLASLIRQNLGITGKNNVSASITDGLPRALAADVLNTLDSLGLFQEFRLGLEPLEEGSTALRIVPFDEGKHKNSQFVLRGFKREDGALSSRIYDAFHGARNDLTRVLDPNAMPEWSIGQPEQNTEKFIRGTKQKLSGMQKTALTNLNNLPFELNKTYLDQLVSMGREEYLSTLGWTDPETMEKVNKYDRDVRTGVNMGLERSWAAMLELQAQLERESTKTGKPVTEIPVFFNWYATTNGRLMMDNSLGPQSNKLVRELVTTNRTTIDTLDPIQMRDALLSIAQGLGYKVENNTHEVSIDWLDRMLTAPLDGMTEADQVQPRKMRAVLDAIMDDDTDSLPLLLAEAGINTNRGLHAMQLMAALESAELGAKVETYLPYELDGKTDGPVNAIGQFGMWRPDMSVLANLRRGGYFINDPQVDGAPSTINQTTKKMGDLYQHVATGTKELLQALIQTHDITRPFVKSLMGMMIEMGRMEISPDGKDVVFARSLTKHPVTATSYAGGVTAIVNEQAANIEAAFASTISEYLLDPANLVKRQNLEKQVRFMKQIAGQSLIYSKKKEAYFVASDSKTNFNFNFEAEFLKNFTLTAAQLKNIRQNLKVTLAGKIKTVIDQEIGSTVEGMQMVVQTTQVMATIQAHAFAKEYERLRQQRIEEGVLRADQALSRGDESQVLKSLQVLSPILQTAYTIDEQSRDYGIGVADKSNKGAFAIDGKPQEVGGLANNRWMANISMARMEDIGVRAAALFNIGAGDANMMVQMFQDPNVRALNVFDGFEATVGQINEMGNRINKAVHDGWMFNALESAATNFTQALPDMLAYLTANPDAQEVIDKLVGEGGLANLGREIRMLAVQNQAVKELANTTRLANDHMAGSMNPYVQDGVHYANDEDFLAAAAQAADEASPAGNLPTADTAAAEFLTENNNTNVPVAGLVRFLDGHTWDSPVQKYIWKLIKPLIPSNLEILQANRIQDLLGEFYQRYPQNHLPGDAAATFVGRTIFWGNQSAETILHELVHASTFGLVKQAYTAGSILTGSQRQAVSNLEDLARSFSAEDYGTMVWSVQRPTQLAQQVVKDYLDNGNIPAAINELQAWATNTGVQEGMSRLLPKKLQDLITSFLASVRKLLGIENARAETYLSQVLSNTAVLVQNAAPNTLPDRGMVLSQKLSNSGNGVTNDRLERLGTQLDNVIQAALNGSAELTALNEANQIAATSTLAAFIDAGFYFSPQASHVFQRFQATLGMGLQHNPRAMNLAQTMYESVVKKITPESFLRDPYNPSAKERDDAQKKFNALMGRGTSKMMQQNRSNLLANFLALALTNEQFREVLDGLPTPTKEKVNGDFNTRVEGLAGQVFDWVGEVGLGIDTGASLRHSLDRLAEHLLEIDNRTSTKVETPLNLANDWARGQMSTLGQKARKMLDQRVAKQQGEAVSKADTVVNVILAAAQALESDREAGLQAEVALSNINDTNLYKPIREIMAEVIGTQDSNRGVNHLVNAGRVATSHIRQRLREVIPKQVRKAFHTKLEQNVWADTVRAIGQVDAQSLLGAYTTDQVLDLYEDATLRRSELAAIRDELGSYSRGQAWNGHVERLARYLATGVIPDGETLAYRNAESMALLLNEVAPPKMDQAGLIQAAELLDRAITLQAIEFLSPAERISAVTMLRDKKGGAYVLRYLKTLRDRELKKAGGRYTLNAWKGHIPSSSDPRKRVVLVEKDRVAEMEALGFEVVGDYKGDTGDIGKRVYMSTKTGSQPTFNQGALQTTRTSYMGLDMVGGYTLDGRTGGMITDKDAVSRIFMWKQATGKTKIGNIGTQLMPIYDNDGSVVAYERPIDAKLREEYTKDAHDLAESIAMWEGRIQEEALAQEHNTVVADEVKRVWDTYGRGREKEFVDISSSKDPTLADAWSKLPPQTRAYLKKVFPGGAVMVRKDMLNNVLGYRSASVTDLWSDKRGEWNPQQKEFMRQALIGVLGKSAYKYVHTFERGWQGFVGIAKDTIVVKSLVVGWSNFKANQLQLMLSGVNPVHGFKVQSQAMSEVNTYLRNERKLAEIHADIAASNDPKEKERLRRLKRSLQDANDRMMIAPLIKAGELPSIAEDLSEGDNYSLVGDFTGWVEKQVNQLPDGVATAAKWAAVAKDTPLYQGLNRFIQYGDFTAKVALFQHLKNQGLSEEAAIKQISEEFVNYSLLPGRHRTYLEQMGLTWFANYKIRIQKILLRHIRNNPFRALMISGGAALVGFEHLFEAVPWNINYDYLLGPEPIATAHESIVWNQLFN